MPLRLRRGSLRIRGNGRGAPLGAAALLLAGLAAGCGYHVAGRAARLPAGWKTIAVPALVNRTHRYRIEQRLTQAVIHELLARTSYRIVQNERSADAVLRGEVTSIDANAVLFDTQTGRATTMLVTLHVKAELIDRQSNRVVYQNPDFVFRDEYQISADPKSFFEEEDPALDRMARDFAASLVSAILENF
jgi:outer membrane lipopolysaccharide assembly protein LptE/RlpB